MMDNDGSIHFQNLPFLSDLYDLVDDQATDALVSWRWIDGRYSFIVWDAPEFSLVLLPKYFKHTNFSSFVRQLYRYGFRKVNSSSLEYYNDDFVRGERQLLNKIRRNGSAQAREKLQQAAALEQQQGFRRRATHDRDLQSKQRADALQLAQGQSVRRAGVLRQMIDMKLEEVQAMLEEGQVKLEDCQFMSPEVQFLFRQAQTIRDEIQVMRRELLQVTTISNGGSRHCAAHSNVRHGLLDVTVLRPRSKRITSFIRRSSRC